MSHSDVQVAGNAIPKSGRACSPLTRNFGMNRSAVRNRSSVPGSRAPTLVGCLTFLTAAIAFGMAPGHAEAGNIIYEDFNRPNGTNMNNTAPDLANVPGGLFTTEITGWTAQTGNNQLQIGADTSLNGYLGSYNTGVLHLSADISTGNTSGSASQQNRGVGLGLNSSATGSWDSAFTGLRLTPDGQLLFQSGHTMAASVYVGTSCSGSNLCLFGYDVDLATGTVSNILLQGSSANFSALVAASAAHNYFGSDDYVSVFGGGSAGGQFAYIDNLLVANSEIVPEPVSAALFGTGIGLLGFWRRRPKRAA